MLASMFSVRSHRLVSTFALSGAALLGVSQTGCSEPADPEGAAPCEGKGNICTFMGDGRAALGPDGVEPLEVSLYLPQDLTWGPDGKPYVLDWNNHRVRSLDDDGLVQTVLGTGELGDAPDGEALDTKLNHPTHVAFSPEGKLVLSAWHNSKVMEMDLGSGKVEAICGTGDRAFAGEDTDALDAVLDLPVATAFDSDGRLYIMDQGNQRIRRVDSNGVINTLVGPVGPYLPEGYVEVCGAQEDPSQAPTCVFCLEAEADQPNCAGPPARPQGFKGESEPGTESFMNQPFSQSAPPAGRMEMGPDDVLYFTDSGNHLVRALDPDGTVRTVLGAAPEPYDPTELATAAPRGGYAGDGDDQPLEARFNRPYDVAVAPDGTLFIADTQNSCVRKYKPGGRLTTVAGVCEERGFDGDGGPADEAHIDRPYGIALDQDGNLYIADTYNHRIRVVYAE